MCGPDICPSRTKEERILVSRRDALFDIALAVLGAAGLFISGTTEAGVHHARRTTHHAAHAGGVRRRTRRRTRRRLTRLPRNHTTTVVAGTTYYVVEGVTYEAVSEEGEVVYVEVIDDEEE